MFKKIALCTTAMMMFATTATADECGVVRLNYLKAIKASSGTSDKVIDEIAKMGSAFENAAGDSHKEVGEQLAKNKNDKVAAAGVVMAAAGSMEKGVAAALEHAAAVISAIDEDRDDPDDLFLTLSTETDDDSAFWPAPNENTELARVGTKVNLSGVYVPYILGLKRGEAGKDVGVNFFDWDGSSRNDHLGQVVFHINDKGEGPLHTAMLGSKHGGSLYGVGYEIIPVTCPRSALAFDEDSNVTTVMANYSSASTNGATTEEAILLNQTFTNAMIVMVHDVIAYDNK